MSPADIRLLIMVLNEIREMVNSLELVLSPISDWLSSPVVDARQTVIGLEKKLSKRISELEDLAERMDGSPPGE